MKKDVSDDWENVAGLYRIMGTSEKVGASERAE
jgi:hypothetical protein